MLAVKGIIQGDTVIIPDKDIIVTILDFPYGRLRKEPFDLDQFVMPTERGKNADLYIRELRENDKL